MQHAARIVGVTRIWNEEQLIEPFLRHHRPILDRMIVLDTGSTDATLDIVRALHREGLGFHLYSGRSVIFAQQVMSTVLYRLALLEGADWVVFLDCDEFMDMRRVPEGLAAYLSGLSPATACLAVPMFRYVPSPSDPPHGRNPLQRTQNREPQPHATKVIVRRMDPARVAMRPGNHAALIDGRIEYGAPQSRLALAHYPERSPAQFAAKAIIGRLRLAASGKRLSEGRWSEHYIEMFEAMKRDPVAALSPDGPAGQAAALVHDPAHYLGAPLRHTRPSDDAARLITLLIGYAETLARSHGDILDRKRLIEQDLLRQAGQVTRVL